MSKFWPFKDPDENLDYEIDWSEALAGDTISLSAWTFPTPSGVSKTNESKTSTSTTIWLNGGIEGQTAIIHNRITTAGGRIMDQTVSLKIKAK